MGHRLEFAAETPISSAYSFWLSHVIAVAQAAEAALAAGDLGVALHWFRLRETWAPAALPHELADFVAAGEVAEVPVSAQDPRPAHPSAVGPQSIRAWVQERPAGIGYMFTSTQDIPCVVTQRNSTQTSHTLCENLGGPQDGEDRHGGADNVIKPGPDPADVGATIPEPRTAAEFLLVAYHRLRAPDHQVRKLHKHGGLLR